MEGQRYRISLNLAEITTLGLGCAALEAALRQTLEHPGGHDATDAETAKCQEVIEYAIGLRNFLAHVAADGPGDHVPVPTPANLN